MKKFITLSVCLLISAAAAFADTRTFLIKKTYNSLSTSSGASVTYVPSDKISQVKVSGPADKIKDVKIEIKGSTLKISAQKKKTKFFTSISNTLKGVKITVTGPMITEFEASSASSIRCSAPLSATKKTFEIEASSGAAVCFANISGRKAEVDCSSGAALNIGGLNADKIVVEASSGAAVNISDISAKQLSAEASSGAAMTLAGHADRGDFEASSGACMNAKALKLIDSHVEKSSGGTISL